VRMGVVLVTMVGCEACGIGVGAAVARDVLLQAVETKPASEVLHIAPGIVEAGWGHAAAFFGFAAVVVVVVVVATWLVE